MNSYHGWWSLGAVAGGLLGAASAQIELPLWSQGAAGLIIFGVLAALSLRLMLPGHDSTERPPAAGPSAASGAAVPAEVAPSGFRLAGMSLRDLGLVMALGMFMVFCGCTEDVGRSWVSRFVLGSCRVI